MVMGDDTWAFDGATRKVLENDFSRYDRTQHYLLRELANQVLARAGEDELLRSRDRMYARKIVFKKPRGVCKTMPPIVDIHGETADMRNTGETATCQDNTIVNGCTFVACWGDLDPLEMLEPCLPLEAKFLELGLVAKLKFVDIQDSTFLKGAILPCTGATQFSWVRLPSFVLKFGKTLKDPRQIVKKPWDLEMKCQSVLLGQWLGYGDMRTNWMYLRIDAVIRDLCSGVTPHRLHLKDWQVVQNPTWIQDEDWNSFLLSRYKISVEEAEDFCTYFEGLATVQLPAAYSHPILRKLWETDY